MKKFALGIDIGGSGIKGAIVDLKTGEFATDRLRIPTPQPATPQAVADVVKEIVDSFAAQLDDGPIGITVPAIVTHGVTRSAANIDPAWVDAPAEQIFESLLGRDITLVNDADAAGVAEVRYGAARGARGLTILTTLGIRAIDCGVMTEVGAGTQTSWVPFAAGRFTAPPVVTVAIASPAGAHTWDAPRATNIGPTGFSLLTKNGAGCIFNWIAVQK